MKKPYTCGAVWDAMSAAPGSTNAQLAAAAGLKPQQVSKALNRLKAIGVATYRRKGSAAHWTATGPRPHDGRPPDFVRGCHQAKAPAPAPTLPTIDGCTLAQVWR